MSYLSQRVRTLKPSATLAMTARAQALRQAGVDVLAMSAGEPDFATPAHIGAAGRAAIDAGETRYTPVAGTVALRRAVVDMVARTYGWQVQPGQVSVGTGGKQVLFNAIAALLDPGDEALFAAPYWVSYPDMLAFAGAVPVPVAATEAQGFLPSAADYAARITARTRLLILNSPSNPTGAAYDAPALAAIAALLRAHPNIFAITDDIYSGLVYDGPFVSLAQLAPDLAPRLLIATGVSKSYAMTGWRIGFGIGPKDWIAGMNDLQGACTSGACSIAQAAAVAAVTGDQSEVARMREAFCARRDRMVAGLRTIPRLQLLAPRGAFYAFPRVDAYFGAAIADSHALCEHLLEHAHLALVPGSAFGSDAHVRLSFACSNADIDEGVRRLAAGLAALDA